MHEAHFAPWFHVGDANLSSEYAQVAHPCCGAHCEGESWISVLIMLTKQFFAPLKSLPAFVRDGTQCMCRSIQVSYRARLIESAGVSRVHNQIIWNCGDLGSAGRCVMGWSRVLNDHFLRCRTKNPPLINASCPNIDSGQLCVHISQVPLRR